jgi:hypothetical protein
MHLWHNQIAGRILPSSAALPHDAPVPIRNVFFYMSPREAIGQNECADSAALPARALSVRKGRALTGHSA